jgi:hypothetical protein
VAEVDGAIADARRAAQPDGGVIGIGYGPFSRSVVTRIVDELETRGRESRVRLDEELMLDAVRRVGAHDLTAAVVMETTGVAPSAPVRIDTYRDEPLLAALPRSHDYASADAVPFGVFCRRVCAPAREPPGAGVQRLAADGVQSCGVRAGADAEDVERAVGSPDVAGREW